MLVQGRRASGRGIRSDIPRATMKTTRNVLTFALAATLAACGPSKSELRGRLMQVEAEMSYLMSVGRVNPTFAELLIANGFDPGKSDMKGVKGFLRERLSDPQESEEVKQGVSRIEALLD